MGLFNKWKKVRDKYLRQWGGIIDKYELNIPQDKYYHIATALGKAEGKSWLQRFVEGVFSGNIFSILGAIASIVTGGVLGLLAGALTLAQNVYTAVIGEKSAKLATALNAVQSHTSLLKEKQEVYSTGDKITEYIVYTDYEIYANGSIYNKNNAGSQTYSPSLVYDTSKGIYGKVNFEEFDEQTQNRAHFTKAGNKGYFQQELGVSFALSEGGLTNEQVQDSLENNVRVNHRRIVSGFTELAAAKFNYTGELEAIYQWVIEQQIYPFWHKMVNNDFLDKLKNYQRAKRADFNYLFMSFFTKKNITEEEKKKKYKEVWKQTPEVKDYVKRFFADESLWWPAFCKWNDEFFNLNQNYYFNNAQALKNFSPLLGYFDTIYIDGKTPYRNYFQMLFLQKKEKVVIRQMKSINILQGTTTIYNKVITNFNELKELAKKGFLVRFIMKYEWVYNNTDSRGSYANKINIEKVLDEAGLNAVFTEFKNAYEQTMLDELFEYEYSIINDLYFIQKSRVYTLERKAEDHLQLIDMLLFNLLQSLDYRFYLITQMSFYPYYDNASGEQKELPLILTSFQSVDKSKKTFYTLENELLLRETDTIFDKALKTNNGLRAFYFDAYNHYLGNATQNNKSTHAFVYENYIAYFKSIDEFDIFRKSIYYDKALDSFDFDKIDLDEYYTRGGAGLVGLMVD
ncbi:hypothetical protein [Campylobacter cuniculorum]|uniref:hypothetical protein n=1 Tax=Campylobacter cuniculorum TaxID=374106 RepID=UPI000481A3D6|nr:hypothetical protein [Campylobacter cuniculorum]